MAGFLFVYGRRAGGRLSALARSFSTPKIQERFQSAGIWYGMVQCAMYAVIVVDVVVFFLSLLLLFLLLFSVFLFLLVWFVAMCMQSCCFLFIQIFIDDMKCIM